MSGMDASFDKAVGLVWLVLAQLLNLLIEKWKTYRLVVSAG